MSSIPVVRGLGVDVVLSVDGSGAACAFPMPTSTGTCSATVFIDSIGVVRSGDIVAPHPKAGCELDVSQCIASTVTVFAETLPIARIGDTYGGVNTITTGSPTVFSG